MVDIVFQFSHGYIIRNQVGIWLQKDDHPLQAGNYYILTAGTMEVIEEEAYSPRDKTTKIVRTSGFRQAVRKRDGKCIVTGLGEINAATGHWAGLEAAHVFPLALEKYWIRNDYAQYIDIIPRTGGPMNSVQNGLLLDRALHTLFDAKSWSINPDVCFASVLFATFVY